MIKNLMIIFVLGLLLSCSSNKPVVRTSKTAFKSKTLGQKTSTPATKPAVSVIHKVEKESAETKNQNSSSTEILEATSKVKVTTELVLAYIDTYKEVAKENMKKHGVPASIALAQAILESGAGTGNLSRQANNHFGIKCHKGWTGESIKHDDDEAQECFRKYDKVLDSYHDYASFLKSRKWYDPLFKLKIDDYKGWAKGLKSAGYATDPAYPSKLIGLIERYQLNKFDTEVLGFDYVPSKTVLNEKMSQNNESAELRHNVEKGDTLFSISRRYNISLDDLKKKNNITDDSISVGQKLQIK
jgi:flagellum-specific peptidoglycan hydrolase FlgJ